MSHCGGSPPPIGSVGHVSGFTGFVVADEPRAALIGRDALSAGGKAADAVVAMYFALSVTMPLSAGLGSSGACVVHDLKGRKTEALEFMPRPAAEFAPGSVPAAAPATVRAMAALQARYGLLRWEQLVFPAERLARFGHPASRAFASALAEAFPRIAPDSDARKLFAAADGTPLREGDNVLQLDLAGIIGQIRANGGGELYTGVLGRRIADNAKASGIALGYDDLTSVRPAWVAPIRASWGSHTVDFPNSAGGTLAASLWRTLGDERRYGRGSAAERAYGVYQAALAALGPAQPYDPGVAAFAALDPDGNAVACAVTLNGPFGTGRMIRGTGIFAARAPSPDADPALAIAPVVVSNPNNGNTFLAAGATGIAAPVALGAVMARAIGDERPLDEALAEPRVAPAGPGAALVETSASAEVTGRIGAAGVRITPVPAIGNVEAIWCPEGLLVTKNKCIARSDPRGFGFASGGIQ